MTTRELIRMLKGLGFKETRQSGSHKRFEDGKGHRVTEPDHKGDLKIKTLNSIFKQAGIK